MEWVKNTDMHPQTNIQGRMWRVPGTDLRGVWYNSLSLDRLTFDEYQSLEWGFIKSPEHTS
jgi:hypothetical protein